MPEIPGIQTHYFNDKILILIRIDKKRKKERFSVLTFAANY